MSFNSTTLLKLAALRLDPDQMAGVVEILADYEAAEEARKIAQRDRARKSRASRDGNATATRAARDAPRERVTPVEDKTLTSVIEPQKKENIEDAFAGVLSPELAHEVVVHRKAMKKPISAFGAKLLAKQIASCPDPTLAAETMIASGWQSVKPEYMRPNQRGSPKARTAVDVAEDLLREMETANADPTAKIEGHSAPPLRLSDYRHG